MTGQEVEVIPPGAPLESYDESATNGAVVAIGQPRAALPMHANAGTVSIEMEAAIAKVQGKILVAQRCPRNVVLAQEEFLQSCKMYSFASKAFYSYKRGGENVVGPSIRFAEEAARCWGNIDSGLLELSHHDGATEMQAYAWDMQKNAISTQNFTVQHKRDTKSGGKDLTSGRDIYENNANMGSRRMRARILAVLPHWFVIAGEEECRKTIAGGAGTKTIQQRVTAMLSAFASIGVTAQQLEAKIGHALTNATPDDLTTLLGAYQAIKDGVSSIADEFSAAPSQGIAAVVTASASKVAPAATKPAAAASPEQAATKKAAPPPAEQPAAETELAAQPKTAAPATKETALF